MNRTRRNFLSLLGATALSGCVSPAIVARDKNDPFEGGIGGTGIVGVVTGFGSIMVNGLKVEVTSRTEFRTALGSALLEDLRPGHSVTIAATRGRNGFVARRVTQDQLLIGTLHHGPSGFSVNGVPVYREAGSLGVAVPGRRIVVSGVWTPNGVATSRIDPAPDGPDMISGTAVSDGNALFVGGSEIQTTRQSSRLDGAFIVASGAMTEDRFKADSVREGRFNGVNRLNQISADGFLEPIDSAPGFRLAGLGHSFARDTRLAAIGSRRALYFGRYDGLFGANRGYVMPASFTARQQVLNTGLDDSFDGPLIRL